jgi:hypothetical protein
MKSQGRKQSLVWGGLLILFGVVGLVEAYTDLTAWGWVAVLAAAGLGAFAVYLTDRSEWGLLIPAYVMWVVAGLIALITLGVLRDPFIPTYVLAAIMLPFLVTYLRDREQWWALIPAYVLLAVGVMVGLIGQGVLSDLLIPVYVLAAILLPFLVTYLRDREQWWALIPAYVLLAVGVMVGLIGQGFLNDLLIPAYVMFAIALPFFVVYARDSSQWWALIPGGIMTLLGLSFLVAEGMFQYVAAVALLLAGAWTLARQFARGEPSSPGPAVDDSSVE